MKEKQLCAAQPDNMLYNKLCTYFQLLWKFSIFMLRSFLKGHEKKSQIILECDSIRVTEGERESEEKKEVRLGEGSYGMC